MHAFTVTGARSIDDVAPRRFLAPAWRQWPALFPACPAASSQWNRSPLRWQTKEGAVHKQINNSTTAYVWHIRAEGFHLEEEVRDIFVVK